jgi:peptidoglycan/xylan/chitin deacetylase (PgdA/CDA1 family)
LRRLILVFAAVAPVALVVLWMRGAPLAGIGVLALSHALLLYPTLRPNVQWLGPVITCFEPRGKELWLTIDDGPTDDTLDVLAALDVPATFFVKGALARAHPQHIRAMLERGHTIANHSDTHPSATFWCLPPGGIARQIDGGPPSRWFRAPVGMKNPFVHPALRRRGVRLIGWSVRGFDTMGDDIDRIVARIVPRVFPGAIVVLHQGRAISARCIARVVGELRARGYEFVIPDDARLKTKR